MVNLYAILVIKGRRTIDQIPIKFRDDVIKALKDMGYVGV